MERIRTWPIGVAGLLMLTASAVAFAATIEIAWGPVGRCRSSSGQWGQGCDLEAPACGEGETCVEDETLSGFRIGHGSASGTYTDSVYTETLERSATVSGLADCETRYLAVRAYRDWVDEDGQLQRVESETWSNEVNGWPRPRVDGAEPSSITAGEAATITWTGGSFAEGLSVVPLDERISVLAVNWLSCTELTVTLQTTPDITPGAYAIEIINPSSVFGSLELQVETRVVFVIPAVPGVVRTDVDEETEPEPPEPPDPPAVDEIILDDQDGDPVTSSGGAWNVVGPAKWNRPCVYGSGELRDECLAHQTDPGAAGDWFAWSTPIASGTWRVTIYTGGNDRRDPANVWEVYDGDELLDSVLCTATIEPTCASSSGTTSGAIVGDYVFSSGTATVKVIGSALGEGTLADQVTLSRQP